VQAEILMIGTELLLGQIADTNATYIAKALAENGINLYQKTTVGDNRERINRALRDALERSDVVLVSGGLGPTEDDITRDCVAEVIGKSLEYREELYAQLSARFAKVRRPLTDNNKKQAYAPEGSTSIENPNGTAPGLIAEDERGVVICMPGVPRELYAMLDDSVVPFIREKYGIEGLLHSRVLKVCGIGESRVDDAMGDLILSQKNPTVGVLASPEFVRIRITARAASVEEAEALIEPVDAVVRERLPGLVMGVDDATLEGVVAKQLAERGWTVAVRDSFTGGLIAQRLAAKGDSVFRGGVVASSTESVRADLVRDQFGATCGLGVSIQDGEVALEFVTPAETTSWRVPYGKNDALQRLRTAVICLEHIRRHLAGITEASQDAKA
jgi:nicotinamide-nucleotide amidase